MLPKKSVSSVIGIGGLAGAIGGVFPLFIGFILDYYKGIGKIVTGYNIIFVVCSCSFLLAWVIIHTLNIIIHYTSASHKRKLNSSSGRDTSSCPTC